jgi:hypothetical protein
MKLPNFENSSADSSSKIGHDFSNKVVQKVMELKKLFLQKIFNEKKINLKVRFRHFITASQWMDSQNKVVLFGYS